MTTANQTTALWPPDVREAIVALLETAGNEGPNIEYPLQAVGVLLGMESARDVPDRVRLILVAQAEECVLLALAAVQIAHALGHARMGAHDVAAPEGDTANVLRARLAAMHVMILPPSIRRPSAESIQACVAESQQMAQSRAEAMERAQVAEARERAAAQARAIEEEARRRQGVNSGTSIPDEEPGLRDPARYPVHSDDEGGEPLRLPLVPWWYRAGGMAYEARPFRRSLTFSSVSHVGLLLLFLFLAPSGDEFREMRSMQAIERFVSVAAIQEPVVPESTPSEPEPEPERQPPPPPEPERTPQAEAAAEAPRQETEQRPRGEARQPAPEEVRRELALPASSAGTWDDMAFESVVQGGRGPRSAPAAQGQTQAAAPASVVGRGNWEGAGIPTTQAAASTGGSVRGSRGGSPTGSGSVSGGGGRAGGVAAAGTPGAGRGTGVSSGGRSTERGVGRGAGASGGQVGHNCRELRHEVERQCGEHVDSARIDCTPLRGLCNAGVRPSAVCRARGC